MHAILVALFLIASLSTANSPQSAYGKVPFDLPVGNLEDSFRHCEMDAATINTINITDSNGQVFNIEVNIVLETEVVSVVDISELEIWYQVFPSDTILTGIGLIVYEEDLITNRDSFFLFMNDSQGDQQWWFALFRENIFSAPQGQLDTWIVQEENFCGLFEIALPEVAAES